MKQGTIDRYEMKKRTLDVARRAAGLHARLNLLVELRLLAKALHVTVAA